MESRCYMLANRQSACLHGYMLIFAFYSESVSLRACVCVSGRRSRRRRNHFFFFPALSALNMRLGNEIMCVGVLLSRQDGLYCCLLSDLNVIFGLRYLKCHFDQNCEQTSVQMLKRKVESTRRTIKKKPKKKRSISKNLVWQQS